MQGISEEGGGGWAQSAAPKISKKHNKKFIAEKEESNLCRVNDQWI